MDDFLKQTTVPQWGNETGGTATPQADYNPYILSWYFQVVYILAFVLMVLVAAGGNLIVIWIVLAHKRMRTVTNYFLVNLAVADLLITVLNTLFNFVYMVYQHWPFGEIYCKFNHFISICTISASVFTFMAIAIDRYIAIIHPLKPRMGAKTIIGIILAIWIVSTGMAMPILIAAKTHTFYYTKGLRTVCYMEWPTNPEILNSDLVYNIFIMLATYTTPLIILGVTYTKVGITLWGSQAIGERIARQEETVRSKRRVVKMMIVVVIIFGLCWLPQNLMLILNSVDPSFAENSHTVQHIYLVFFWLAMSNSMYNPIIYCWMNQRFRKGFKYVFQWLPCVHWSPSDARGLGRGGGPGNSVRMSVTESTRYAEVNDGNNCSVMQTMIDRLEESRCCTSHPGRNDAHKLYPQEKFTKGDEAL